MSMGSTRRRRASGADAELVLKVFHITHHLEAMAGSAGTELSRGGMVTKLEAGKIALASGTNMVIASGKVEHPCVGSARMRPAPGSWRGRIR